jgi:hypothetical protein
MSISHLVEYELLRDVNRNFKKGDKVIGTEFGAYTFDLVIYDLSMSRKSYVMFDDVKVKEATNENK